MTCATAFSVHVIALCRAGTYTRGMDTQATIGQRARFWLDFAGYVVSDGLFMLRNRWAREWGTWIEDAWLKACADYSTREDER